METRDEDSIHLDLTGLRAEAIDVRLEGGRLMVTAERPPHPRAPPSTVLGSSEIRSNRPWDKTALSKVSADF